MKAGDCCSVVSFGSTVFLSHELLPLAHVRYTQYPHFTDKPMEVHTDTGTWSEVNGW